MLRVVVGRAFLLMLAGRSRGPMELHFGKSQNLPAWSHRSPEHNRFALASCQNRRNNMKNIITLAAAALAFAATPAAAQSVGVGGGFVTGDIEAGNSAGFDFGSKVEGSSASGFQHEIRLGNGASFAGFLSAGTATSNTTMTPLTVDSTSSHAGGFVSGTLGDATIDGVVMNFAQTEAKANFDVWQSSFQNVDVSFGGFAGFANISGF